MTRKHYIMLASVIDAHQWADNGDRAAFVADLATELIRDNPRFDAARFAEACGVEA